VARAPLPAQLRSARRRWRDLPALARRAVIAVAVLLGSIVVFAPLFGFAFSAFLLWLVFVALYVPPWERIRVGSFRVGRWLLPLAFLALVVTYPYYQGKMFQIPVFGPFPDVNTATIMAIFAMMAVGLNVVVGYAGLLDLGYVAFYAMGAYTAAWFASPLFAGSSTHPRAVKFGAVGVAPGVPGYHFSVWLLLLLAGILTAIVGIIIGLPTLRLRGDYLAIVTLGFGEIMPQIARNGDNFLGTGVNLTNGPSGITPIDPPGFGHWFHKHLGLPDNYLTAVNSDRLFFWTAIALLVFTVFCSVRLRDSRLGRAWIAIREDETAAAAMGVPLMRTKTWAYATGAFFGGIAGAYYASFKSATFPDDFFFNISVFILCMVIFGGMGNVWGVIVGAFFLTYLDREGIGNVGGWINDHFATSHAKWFEIWHGTIDVPLYSFGIYGAIILVVMLFRPEGLMPSSRRKAEFATGEMHDEPLYDVSH
jgi:branched-chain amino acid transport system permease protein